MVPTIAHLVLPPLRHNSEQALDFPSITSLDAPAPRCGVRSMATFYPLPQPRPADLWPADERARIDSHSYSPKLASTPSRARPARWLASIDDPIPETIRKPTSLRHNGEGLNIVHEYKALLVPTGARSSANKRLVKSTYQCRRSRGKRRKPRRERSSIESRMVNGGGRFLLVLPVSSAARWPSTGLSAALSNSSLRGMAAPGNPRISGAQDRCSTRSAFRTKSSKLRCPGAPTPLRNHRVSRNIALRAAIVIGRS